MKHGKIKAPLAGYNRGGITQPIYPVQHLNKGTSWLNPLSWAPWLAGQGAHSPQTGASGAGTGNIDTLNNIIDTGTQVLPYLLSSNQGGFGPGDHKAQAKWLGLPSGDVDEIGEDNTTLSAPPRYTPLSYQPGLGEGQPVNKPGFFQLGGHGPESPQGTSGTEVPYIEGLDIDPTLGPALNSNVITHEEDELNLSPGVPPQEVEQLDVYQNINRGNINAKLEKAKRDLGYAINNNDVKAIQKLEGMIQDYETQLAGVPTSDQIVAQDLSNDNVDEAEAIKELEEIKKNTTSETVKNAIDNTITEKKNIIEENKKFISETIDEDVQAGEEGAVAAPPPVVVEPEVPVVPEGDTSNPIVTDDNAPASPEGNVTQGEAKSFLDNIPGNVKDTISKGAEFLGISGQDVGRFLLYYAGSRMAGGSHEGSMQWAGKQALAENQARIKASQELAIETAKQSAYDFSGTPKNFEVGGQQVRAVFDKNTQQYYYRDPSDNVLKVLPDSAVDPNITYQDINEIQKSFDDDIESTLKSANAGKGDNDPRITVDSRAISSQATNIYDEYKTQFGKTTRGSADLKRKIGEAVREVVKRGGTANELKAEVNKKLLKIRTGISENDVAGTNTENFAELDALILRNSDNPGVPNNADYKNDWLAAKNVWNRLPAAKKDKWKNEGWDNFTWFLYNVQIDNRDALLDAGLNPDTQ